MATLIDGRKIAEEMLDSIAKEIGLLKLSAGRPPRLVSISVGGQEDAEIYMRMQEKAAGRIGAEFEKCEFAAGTAARDVISRIEEFNRDDKVTAVIIQRPLEGMGHDKIVVHLAPEKDAEGIHPANLGKIFRRDADIVPCTPAAVMKILSEMGEELYGREVVIIGHSATVGKPLSMMMLNETATVTVCHIGTSEKGDIPAHTRRADILVVAVGKPEMVKADWVKQGAAVIDVGINEVDGHIVGDVDLDGVSEKASAVTPVPGGVGPVTVSALMRNVLRAYKIQNGKL